MSVPLGRPDELQCLNTFEENFLPCTKQKKKTLTLASIFSATLL